MTDSTEAVSAGTSQLVINATWAEGSISKMLRAFTYTWDM